MSVTGRSFASFVQAAHGHEPYPWQTRLAARVAEGDWPDVIDIPTGLGKTSVLDVLVYALARDATRGMPTRVFMVVDRRIVVDAAFVHARRLASALVEHPDLSWAAEALRQRGSADLTDAPALHVVRMRGGSTWDWRWLPSPEAPAVVVSTVDQLGSRLLFRGYGVGERLRPLDAALVGRDSVVVVDEAHLSGPLLDTLRGQTEVEQESERPVLAQRSGRLLVMSATAPPSPRIHRLDKTDALDQRVRQRLDADKRLVCVRRDVSGSAGTVGRELATAARHLVETGYRSVLVFANTVATARSTYDALGSASADRFLVTGRCRSLDRNVDQARWLPRVDASRSATPQGDDKPLVVVATQALEVGADVDVTALVSEAASFDAIAQRLGRLARRGGDGIAPALLVQIPKRHTDDPVYGTLAAQTWTAFAVKAGGHVSRVSLPTEEVPWVATGPGALASLVEPEERRRLSVPPVQAPVLVAEHVRAWARTSPSPLPDQEVSPFLHGVDRGAAQVSVIWRADLPEDICRWHEALDAVPPHSEELVEVPLAAARAALFATVVEISDLESEGTPAAGARELSETRVVPAAVVWGRGENGVRAVRSPADVAPGSTVVLRSDAGGHDDVGWTGTLGGNAPPVPDIGDLATAVPGRRRRAHLRLDPDVIMPLLRQGRPGGLPVDASIDTWRRRCDVLLNGPRGFDDDTDEHAVSQVHGLIHDLTPLAEQSRWASALADLLAALGVQPHVHVMKTDGKRSIRVSSSHQSTLDASDDDSASSSGTGNEAGLDKAWDRRVPLSVHGDAVGARAARSARALGLDELVVEALHIAGRWHDLGKADPRFQVMLHGGDRLLAEIAVEPIAKSGMDPTDRAALREARRRAAWPSGLRHEAASARAARALLRAGAVRSDLDGELVVHLVASHHGWARPLMAAAPDPDPRAFQVTANGLLVTVEGVLSPVDWEQPTRFERLQDRYGVWGLALLEACLRLADMACSEEGL